MCDGGRDRAALADLKNALEAGRQSIRIGPGVSIGPGAAKPLTHTGRRRRVTGAIKA